MKLCDKCKVAHAFLLFAPNPSGSKESEFLCLECAQKKMADVLVVFHDVITSMSKAEAQPDEPERLHTMTIQQLVRALAEQIASLPAKKKAEIRAALDAAFSPSKLVVADAPNPNVNVLELTNADYDLLREMRIKP